MNGKRIAIRTILRYLWGKINARATSKEIDDVEFQELSTNVWFKNGPDASRTAIPPPKTNKGLRYQVLWKTKPCLKWFNNNHAQALVHYQQNLDLHEAPSIDTSISAAFEHIRRYLKYEMQNNFKYCKTFDST